MDLRFDEMGFLVEHGAFRHPQDVMNDLGISYKKAIRQTLADQWWFVGCENIPVELPDYLSQMVVDE